MRAKIMSFWGPIGAALSGIGVLMNILDDDCDHHQDDDQDEHEQQHNPPEDNQNGFA